MVVKQTTALPSVEKKQRQKYLVIILVNSISESDNLKAMLRFRSLKLLLIYSVIISHIVLIKIS